MPTTRSASRQLANAASLLSSAAPGSKRKASTTAVPKTAARQSVKKPRTLPAKEEQPGDSPPKIPVLKPIHANGNPPALLPAKLSFSFEDAKKQLIDADPRFEDIFLKLPCRPFEHLEQVDPFRSVITFVVVFVLSGLLMAVPYRRTLVTSILLDP